MTTFQATFLEDLLKTRKYDELSTQWTKKGVAVKMKFKNEGAFYLAKIYLRYPSDPISFQPGRNGLVKCERLPNE